MDATRQMPNPGQLFPILRPGPTLKRDTRIPGCGQIFQFLIVPRLVWIKENAIVPWNVNGIANTLSVRRPGRIMSTRTFVATRELLQSAAITVYCPYLVRAAAS